MAITSVKEISDNRETAIGDDGIVRRTRSWRAVVDAATVSDYAVIDNFSTVTGIRRFSPWISVTGEVDDTVYAQELRVRDRGDFVYIIEVDYTSGKASTGGGSSPRQERERVEMARRGIEQGEQPPTDATQRQPSVEWGFTESQEALQFDLVTRKPIWNTAKDRFVPPQTRPIAYLTLKVEKNQISYDPIFYLRYANTVNSAPVRLGDYEFPPFTVLCKPITGNRDVEGRLVFFKVTYTFWFNFNRRQKNVNQVIGWKFELLNVGLNSLQLQFVDNELFQSKQAMFEIPGGGRLTQPVPLDERGFRLAEGRPHVYVGPFNRYALADLNELII